MAILRIFDACVISYMQAKNIVNTSCTRRYSYSGHKFFVKITPAQLHILHSKNCLNSITAIYVLLGEENDGTILRSFIALLYFHQSTKENKTSRNLGRTGFKKSPNSTTPISDIPIFTVQHPWSEPDFRRYLGTFLERLANVQPKS